MPLETTPYSRFKRTATTIFNNQEIFGRWTMPEALLEIADDRVQYHRVTAGQEGRPDQISYDYYNTTEFDWLLIVFNDANDVFNWPRAGTVIKIPDRTTVLGEFL
jgi:hypothetical protein